MDEKRKRSGGDEKGGGKVRQAMCERSGTVEAVKGDWRGVSRAFHLDSATSCCRGDIDQNEM